MTSGRRGNERCKQFDWIRGPICIQDFTTKAEMLEWTSLTEGAFTAVRTLLTENTGDFPKPCLIRLVCALDSFRQERDGPAWGIRCCSQQTETFLIKTDCPVGGVCLEVYVCGNALCVVRPLKAAVGGFVKQQLWNSEEKWKGKKTVKKHPISALKWFQMFSWNHVKWSPTHLHVKLSLIKHLLVVFLRWWRKNIKTFKLKMTIKSLGIRSSYRKAVLKRLLWWCRK